MQETHLYYTLVCNRTNINTHQFDIYIYIYIYIYVFFVYLFCVIFTAEQLQYLLSELQSNMTWRYQGEIIVQ